MSWLKKVPKFRSLDISSSSTFSSAHLCSTISRASHSLWNTQTQNIWPLSCNRSKLFSTEFERNWRSNRLKIFFHIFFFNWSSCCVLVFTNPILWHNVTMWKTNKTHFSSLPLNTSCPSPQHKILCNYWSNLFINSLYFLTLSSHLKSLVGVGGHRHGSTRHLVLHDPWLISSCGLTKTLIKEIKQLNWRSARVFWKNPWVSF